jgi:hypothetical protein
MFMRRDALPLSGKTFYTSRVKKRKKRKKKKEVEEEEDWEASGANRRERGKSDKCTRGSEKIHKDSRIVHLYSWKTGRASASCSCLASFSLPFNSALKSEGEIWRLKERHVSLPTRERGEDR